MADQTEQQVSAREMVRLVADVVAAYVSYNNVPGSEVPDLIRTVHGSFGELGGTEKADPATPAKPAVPIRRSIQDDHLVCLEDGKKLKMLKRYLRTKYNLTPEEYRRKWGLPPDYPMVAPNYSKQRSSFAKKIGLGRRR